jgi:RNA polymerase sigma-70 factor (ECF subfamily)
MDEDENSISRVRSGDRDAFRFLIGRHQSAVCAAIAALCPRGADGEDLAQDVFLSAFRHLASFDAAKGSFRTWLLAIARNRCRSACRRPVMPQFDPLPERADGRTPETLASEAECFERLDAGLAALPEEQRLVFVLVEMQGRSYQEAAQIAEVDVGTIKSRLFRAREWLRETLRPMLIEEERAAALPPHRAP